MTTSGISIREKIVSTFEEKQGKTYRRHEIIDMVLNEYPKTNRRSVIPSDYCYNITNKGIKFEFASPLFEYNEGLYKCLGRKYQYTGKIYWKRQPIGIWENGKIKDLIKPAGV